MQDTFGPRKKRKDNNFGFVLKPLLIVFGLCYKDSVMGHSVAVNFSLDASGRGIIFEGCQASNEPTTKGFILTESTGNLFMQVPQDIFFFYLRSDIGL